ncbi:monovalent cation/H(+) antiporter subunit G [Actinomadura gamaensis]|uniref:Monovalent cation/H(+) antiporter subunit G n=1 Tax=Actinomadura gamaensis TaxID=1763541 RepID=A0ABV9U5C5_9ACTN
MREALFAVAAVVGLGFSLSGAVGILRMPDVYTRIQCSSKTVTMGVLPALLALLIAEGPFSLYGGRALIVAVLLAVLNPAAAHALARAAYRTGVPMWRGAVRDESLEGREDRAGNGGPDGRRG